MNVDIERIVVQHLLADTNLTGVIGENRVATELPADAPLPRVRVTLNGGGVAVRGWLYRYQVTVEGWADDKRTAWEALVEALASLESGLDAALVDGGVITAVDQDSGVAWVPDPETGTPRYLATVSITAHPEP